MLFYSLKQKIAHKKLSRDFNAGLTSTNLVTVTNKEALNNKSFPAATPAKELDPVSYEDTMAHPQRRGTGSVITAMNGKICK